MKFALGIHKMICMLATMTALVVSPGAIFAQNNYPVKPVRIIVPSVAGGGLDTFARIIAQRLNEKYAVPFIVDNRPGAGGAIGMEAGARAAPDGYTFVIISATHAATSNLQAKPTYSLQNNFAPIVWGTTQPYIVNVNPKVPARSVKDLISLAKAKPGSLNYGSPGAGSAQHLAGVLLSSMSGAQFFHIPYKGGAQVVNDILAGQLDMSFTNYLVCRPLIQSGKLRALAVTTRKRSEAVPDLPSVSEAFPGYDADNWYGLIAPAKTPPKILDALHREVTSILQAKEIKQRLADDAAEVVNVSREEFGRHIGREVVKWGDVILKAGITAR